jgi:elongation factor Ts
MSTTITTSLIKELRDMTGAGMMDCKAALEATDGDLEKAVVYLREKGIAKAGKRAGRTTEAGVVESYLHRTSEDFPPQVGTLVELNCESDFVAKGDDFRMLARELAMHIAAAGPRWVATEDVPEDVLASERDIYRKKAEQDGKPPQVIDRIVEGQLKSFHEENCLLEQPWVREPKTPIKDLIAQTVAKVQENITVRRFSRFSIKES